MLLQATVGDQMTAALISVAVSTCVSILVAGATARSTEKRTAFSLKRAAVTKDIEDVSIKARAYWRSTGPSPESEVEILMLLDRLFHHVADYFDHATSATAKPEIELLIENFHELATGGAFASSTRAANTVLADQIRNRGLELQSRFTDLKLSPKK